MVITVHSDVFLSQITQKNSPVVVEYFASWCPKCSLMAVVYERTSVRLNDIIPCYKADIDLFPEKVSELGLEIYPTFIVYQKGVILGYTSGLLSEATLFSRICELVNY